SRTKTIATEGRPRRAAPTCRWQVRRIRNWHQTIGPQLALYVTRFHCRMVRSDSPLEDRGPTMLLELNRDSHVPLYAQIVSEVCRRMTDGALKVGDRLPANRELA